MRAVLALLALAALSSCKPQIPSGRFSCDPALPSACPAGYVCQCRAGGADAACEDRCWLDEGPVCGDGVRNTDDECDGADLGGKDCLALGYHGGALACSAACRFDTSGCSEFCGDGVANGTEQCDGVDQRGLSCTDFGAPAGALGCTAGCQSTIDRCLRPGWLKSDRVAGPLRGVFLRSSTDVVAVGTGGLVRHWDGAAWSTLESGTRAELRAVAGAGPSTAFAVGAGGVVLGFDGARWAPLPSPTTAGLDSVWVGSAQEAFAVGASGTILAWDGASWKPEDSGTTEDLLAVSGGGGAVYSTGRHGTVLSRGTSGWKRVDLGLPEFDVLTALEVFSGSEVVVASNSTFYRFDGASWRYTIVPAFVFPVALWGAGPHDLWAVDLLRVARTDGEVWTAVLPPFPGTPLALSGRATNDVWAVGRTADGAGISYHWEGGFQAVGYEPPLKESDGFRCVWGQGENDVFAMGAAVRRYDGRGWSELPEADLGAYVTGLWGRSPDDLFAASLDGRLFHWDGATWTLLATVAGNFFGAWGSGEDLFVTGIGLIGRYSAKGGWQPTSVPFTTRAIWGTSATDVYAVGEGVAAHFDGAAWTRMPGIDPEDDLRAVWGSTATDLWAAGKLGLRHWDGTTWTVVAGEERTLVALWGSSATDVFAFGNQGAATHFDGSTWSPISVPSDDNFYGVWGSSAHDVWAVGDRGTILHLATALPSLSDATCGAVIPLYCADRLSGSNAGAPPHFAGLSGAPWSAAGGKVVYALDAPFDGTARVRLTPHGADLDLFALSQGADGACAAAGPLLGRSQSPAEAVEQVEVPLVQGRRTFFVVDGAAGASAGFLLQAGCTRAH